MREVGESGAIWGCFFFFFGAVLLKLAFYLLDAPHNPRSLRLIAWGIGAISFGLVAQGTVLILRNSAELLAPADRRSEDVRVLALVAAALIGHSGEWVTRESDGARICQLSRDLFAQEIVRAEGWCSNWTIEPPKNGERIDSYSGWVRGKPLGGGAQLHFEDGWRPYE